MYVCVLGAVFPRVDEISFESVLILAKPSVAACILLPPPMGRQARSRYMADNDVAVGALFHSSSSYCCPQHCLARCLHMKDYYTVC